MAQILINKLLNCEIKLDLIVKWILHKTNETDQFPYDDVSREEFISFFINFIHEKVGSLVYEDTVSKHCTSKQKKLELNPVNNSQFYVSNDCHSTPKTISKTDKSNDSSFKITRQNPNSSVTGSESAQVEHDNSSLLCSSAITPERTTTFERRNLFQICNSNDNQKKTNLNYPISPLHSFPNDFRSPTDKKMPNLCLGDFLSNPKTLSKKRLQNKRNTDENLREKNVRSRRINPTTVTNINVDVKSDNCFDFKEVKAENTDEQRNILLDERNKIHWQKNTNVKILKSAENVQEFVADIDKVTFKNELDIMASLYSTLFQHNYILNMTAELCFLIGLLFHKQTENDEFSEHNSEKTEVLFNSGHNKMYFSSKVLEKNAFLFYILDRASIKLLIDNKNLKIFSKKTSDVLKEIYESKSEKKVEILKSDMNFNVCFISDTDNRDNFPYDSSFHAFRKQRDVFYEILRIWETNHSFPTWNFTMALGSKIKYLFDIHPDPVNYMHFARLFKAQLLKNCAKNFKEDVDDTSDFSTLSCSLSGITSEKFSLLKNRITTKQFSTGINTAPSFSGYQEFYKDFLTVANNYSFFSHLKNQIVYDIKEINNFKFIDEELNNESNASSEGAVVVSSTLRKSFISHLKSLRVLAKFLGLLESFPYKNSNVSIDKILNSQIVMRNQIQNSLNLEKILKTALNDKTLALTVPWVVKYISVLDFVVLRTEKMSKIYDLLFFIYNHIPPLNENISKPNFYNLILIKLCLGWLFDLPNFPEEFYYQWCFKQTRTDTSNFDLIWGTFCLDNSGVVDPTVIHICCPYLGEIKNLLAHNTKLCGASNRVKHITPVTALSTSSELIKKKIQGQLEEAFFNGQPVSVRKTVEFVSERLASACVKQICYEIVPEFKKKSVEVLKNDLRRQFGRNFKNNELHEYLQETNKDYSSKKVKELKELIKDSIEKELDRRIITCHELLLSFDSLPKTKQVCTTICTRNCREKINEWIKIHINESIFSKDFESAVKSLTSPVEKGITLDLIFRKEHNDNVTSPAVLLNKIRSFIWDVTENPDVITSEKIVQLFECIDKTLEERTDVTKFNYMCFKQMTLDLVLSLITYVPHLAEKQFLSDVAVPFFKRTCSDDLFNDLICPKNVMLLVQSPDGQKSWTTFALFVSLLLKERLLTEGDFESGVLALYKFTWDDVVLRNLSKFYQNIVENYRQNFGQCEDRFLYLLNFMSDFCVEL